MLDINLAHFRLQQRWPSSELRLLPLHKMSWHPSSWTFYVPIDITVTATQPAGGLSSLKKALVARAIPIGCLPASPVSLMSKSFIGTGRM